MDIQALTGSSIDTRSWAIKKVRGRLMIEPKPQEIVSPEEKAFANSVYLQVELKYIWVVDGANKECQIAMSWAPYYYPLDSTTPREYTTEFSDTKFHKVFNTINSGFTIENIASNKIDGSGSSVNLNSQTIKLDNPQSFKLVDTEWKSDPTFSFIYNTEEDGITYSISIPKWTISRPSKYDNNLVFNKDGLEDFINQIHEYPKTVFGINTSIQGEDSPSDIPMGNVPFKVHGKWYGVPVNGLSGESTSFNITSKYATYDDTEKGNNPIPISQKYVKKAGDTMTGGLIINATAQDGKEKLFWEVSNPTSTDAPLRRIWSGYSSDAPTTWYLQDDSVGSAIIKSVRNGTTIDNTFNGNSNSATALLHERKFLVNLETEENDVFNGTQDADNIGITGTLPIAHGGTGATTAEAARSNLGLGSIATANANSYVQRSGDTMTGYLTNIMGEGGAFHVERTFIPASATDFPDNQGNIKVTTNQNNTWVDVSNTDTYDHTLHMSLDAQSNTYYIGLYSYNYACIVDRTIDGKSKKVITELRNSPGWLIYRNPNDGRAASSFEFQAPKVFNAVFNDYAECRTTINLTPGHVVVDQDDGSLACSTTRLQPGAQVISDTYGHCMGETETAKTPLAVAGRVLVYTYQPRENYHAGMAVCSAPNGTVDIMTREEIRDYPDCIVGIVSEIPQYETWGTDNVEVNGRIWIKVK